MQSLECRNTNLVRACLLAGVRILRASRSATIAADSVSTGARLTAIGLSVVTALPYPCPVAQSLPKNSSRPGAYGSHRSRSQPSRLGQSATRARYMLLFR
jgi:hypothetical protein